MMSTPIDTTRVEKYAAIQSALCELLSAESSLNMYPDPIEPAIIRTVDMWERVTAVPEPAYTSAVDGNAKHAIEHLHAAFRLMNMAHHDQEGLKMQVFRLCMQLRELGVAPKIKTWLDDE
jgi:hypothetical protein